ncbi:Os06g0207950 [Oryza sativa Japonica Group]|uniref:Os06g0207950 protein n=1 Tax=Oryza sativa subsp. japonica TaxID=39947 RepID=A0A0P0WU96_ORYSJ|nr:hypothetical protein EE612_032593 [Oryza sativa]KAF2925743.1 hypothetical protein DAI22_06g074500 [Oryza sativa Japonica Group]BAS96716.1 Os06g0207950 [Oryza sativa Japonica Group]
MAPPQPPARRVVAPRYVPRRGMVLRAVFAVLLSWLLRRRRHHRRHRRRPRRHGGGGGVVEPAPPDQPNAAG